MKKPTFLLTFILFLTNITHSQSYERIWGSIIPIYDQPQQHFSATRKILSIPYVAEVDQNTGNLYIVSEKLNEVVEYNQKNSKPKIFYKIKGLDNWSFIDNIKITSEGDLIICGRTYDEKLATSSAYIKEIFATGEYGSSFIARINKKGSLKWLTYFHEIPQARMALTVDKYDNIYVLNKRFRGDTFESSPFQKNGDIFSKIDFQDVITKLNINGEHLWSTFYSKDDSKINAIMASEKGLYIYGASSSSNNYFNTINDYSEITSTNKKNIESVFISKFDFEGKRIWSTYFGIEKSLIPTQVNNIGRNPSNLTVIGDDVYFISQQITTSYGKSKNIATENTFLNKPPFPIENYTLTKFYGNGKHDWTTYLTKPGFLFKSFHNNALVISTTVNSIESIKPSTTPKTYQETQGGMQDIYTYILSIDGKKQLFGTFYGYEGNDVGFSLPSINGFYTIGFASNYTSEKTFFAAKKATLNKLKIYTDGTYVGNFLSYFERK